MDQQKKKLDADDTCESFQSKSPVAFDEEEG